MITVGTKHVDSISTARAQLVFKHGALEVARTEPMDHVFGLSPRLEHERAGRIEDTLDSEFALGHFSSSISSRHLYLLLRKIARENFLFRSSTRDGWIYPHLGIVSYLGCAAIREADVLTVD